VILRKLTNSSIGAVFAAFLPGTARRLAFPEKSCPAGASRVCRLLAQLMVATAVATGSAGCSRTPPLPKLDADATVLAFGDSLTFGTGAAASESYPAQLQARISRKVINAGVPGEVSADGLARLPALLDETRPKLLILCHGGNDFLRKLGEAEVAANLRAMVKLAQDRGIGVLLIATPKPGLMVSAPDFYAAIAREYRLPFNDSLLHRVLTDNELKSDLIHPNGKGYGLIADEIAALLKKAGAL
jgi:lysophospholipase L1-like esterase